MWRKRIFDIVEPEYDGNIYSRIYDYIMLVFIFLSLLPLAFREQQPIFNVFDKIAVSVFILDYLLRWMTADYKIPNGSRLHAFLVYPFTPFAIVDLLSIIPSFAVLNRAFKLFRISRLLMIMRVFKFVRYSKHMQIILRVLKKEKQILFIVFLIAIGYIFITALIIFNVEDSAMFATFFDALYWATTTLATIGYGDIYPSTELGRFISMFSAVLGIAVIALPSGVITASYLDELREERQRKEKEDTEKKNDEE